MSHEKHSELLEKYPRPWRFEETDPTGTGIILDANDQLIVILRGDMDWNDEEHNDTKREPVYDTDDGAELIDFLIDAVNHT